MMEDRPWMDEELRVVADTAHRFLQQEIAPHRSEWERAGIVPREIWRALGRAGLLCPGISAEHGGGGGGRGHDLAVQEQFARVGLGGSLGVGVGVHGGIVAHYVASYGTPEQKERWLPSMAQGEVIGAIAMTEPGTGSDLQSITTTAARDGDSYVLSGAKTFISNGQSADLVLVAARTGGPGAAGVSLLLVDASLPGFGRGRRLEKIGLHGQDTSELFFDEVRVPADQLLGGGEGRGFQQLMRQLAWERLQLAVGAAASIERAVALTVAYTKERKAFGQRVFDFQNTQFKLAEAATTATVARAFVDGLIAKLLAGTLDDTSAAMAKWWVTEQHGRVMDECLQLFGGYGYMQEYEIGPMFVDARIGRIYGGANEIMKMLVARAL